MLMADSFEMSHLMNDILYKDLELFIGEFILNFLISSKIQSRNSTLITLFFSMDRVINSSNSSCLIFTLKFSTFAVFFLHAHYLQQSWPSQLKFLDLVQLALVSSGWLILGLNQVVHDEILDLIYLCLPLLKHLIICFFLNKI